MLRFNLAMCTFICAIVLSVTNTILGQDKSSFFKKPWPTYSLQNMPQTRFTCHDKILGGYYADPETQCQMFHVCVKVGGVGVQDFRFLCPNSTAFDQEAQICANWADVDCFESKRAPLAEEDESTFHLQRAETGDIRRYKQTTVDQKSRPEQPPNYTKQYETATRGGGSHHHNNHNYLPNDEVEKTSKKKIKTDVTKKPIVSYYTPTTSTTTTTTERYASDDSKQDLDDIFKGSHSSHFFSNRNGGREDDFVDHPVRQQKPNDFNDFSKKSESATTVVGKSRVTPTRSRRPPATPSTTLASTTSTTPAPKITKKVTPYYNTDFYDYSLYKSSTSASTTAAPSTVAATTPKTSPQHSSANRFSFGFNDYQTQLNIQPTTYNPNRLKSSTPKYTEVNRDKAVNNEAFNKKLQKFEQSQQKSPAQNNSFASINEFSEFAKIKTQPPQPFQPKAPAKTFEAPKKSEAEPQYYRSRGQPRQPEPFRTAPTRASHGRATPPTTAESPKEKAVALPEKPRGFVSRGSINYKATTQRNSETYPTVSAQNYKKFSTLVPKDKYDPTTFKPTTYKKSYENNFYQTQQTQRPQHKQQQQQQNNKATTKALPSTTTAYTTANPYYNIDEDDGQYHPELYEIDFPRNKFNLQRSSSTTTASSTTTTTTTSKPYYQPASYQNPASHLKSQQQTAFQKEQSAQRSNDFSDEDELFNTAQSLNFGAASINKLRADIIKAEKTSQQYNSHYNPLNSLTSPKTTTASTPATSSTSYFTYPSYSSASVQQTTQRSTTYAATSSSTITTTTTTTTTRRPTTTSTSTTTTTTTPYPFNITKSGGKHADKKSHKKNDNKKKTSKRPPHADEDTSYDYAYYDTDTLSESPQEYPEYEIQEFTKTRKN
ncbi:mucin-2 isoform X2 [Musca domestica]|uniref:Mucin-2 isoform X2 n=1 Tax=Musca domestica TaxID=7370 RepID=A0ABM3VDV2_MUSDO|nr:mucin-2 isoform X2 [Musca domestica]